MQHMPDIEVLPANEGGEATPGMSVWKRRVLPLLGAVIDLTAQNIIPHILSRLTPTDTASAPTQASAQVRAAGTLGGYRHRQRQHGGR